MSGLYYIEWELISIQIRIVLGVRVHEHYLLRISNDMSDWLSPNEQKQIFKLMYQHSSIPQQIMGLMGRERVWRFTDCGGRGVIYIFWYHLYIFSYEHISQLMHLASSSKQLISYWSLIKFTISFVSLCHE